MHTFDVAGVNTVIEAIETWLMAFGVLVARPMGIMAISPIFTRADNFNSGFVRGAVIAALVVPLWAKLVPMVHPEDMGTIHILVLMFKEVMIGFLLGLPLSVPFYALMIAGDLMDLQRGQNQGRLSTTGGGDDLSITGTLLLMCGIAVYASSGGFVSLTRALYDSWNVWRPLDMLPIPDHRAPVLALQLLDIVFRRGTELALPALIAMLLSDAAMVIIARIAPQMHMDDLMSAARNLVFTIFLPLYAGYLMYYNTQDQAAMSNVLGLIMPVLPPSEHGVGINTLPPH